MPSEHRICAAPSPAPGLAGGGRAAAHHLRIAWSGWPSGELPQ